MSASTEPFRTGRALPRFEDVASTALANGQLRQNLGRATATIRGKCASVVGEMEDWEALRDAGSRIKEHTMATLAEQLERLEASVTAAGGQVHWARDAAEACQIVTSLAQRHAATEVIKVKSITTDEIRLNSALKAVGITAIETDLAELIIQLADEPSSHILVPAIHKNRTEIRDLFRRTIGDSTLSDEPSALAEAARLHLRQKFLTVPFAVSGANFAVADTGAICVVESEGNGRMCLTLPEVLVTVMGIEKVVPHWSDLAVYFQLLPRSSTGERMNPYTSVWTGVHPGDGPQEFHLVLLDNGRTKVLADQVGRQTLHCIRCSACLNVCPVYSRTGGHAYGSVYPGPIGAILTPQLLGVEDADSLPYASTLCGACYDVCPVKINIPEVLLHLRGQIVERQRHGLGTHPYGAAERAAMRLTGWILQSRWRYELAQRAARIAQWPFLRRGVLSKLPGYGARWSRARDLPAVPPDAFRDWWRAR